MSHPDTTELDAYLDEELAGMDARELEAHLAGCAACARQRDERLALRAAIRSQVPRFPAPAALRTRVQAAVRAAASPSPTVSARGRRRFAVGSWWRPLAVAASLVVVALGSWRVAQRREADQLLAQELLQSHVRSLMPGHLTDVPSSDQHTVKPWFNGRLDFSPPVSDFAGAGYPLLGGRLDYVDGRAVAALVYGRRQHVINVFVWPAGRGSDAGPTALTQQGYHVLHQVTPDYTYWVVSDLGLVELREFAGLLVRGDSAARTSPLR